MPVEWYYTTNKQQMGPVSWDELRQLASKRLLKPDDLVWTDGMSEWVKAVRQQGLFQESGASVTNVASQRAEAPKAPPRKSSARQRIDDELDELDDEERKQRRKARKGSGSGLKIGLIIGAVALVLVVLTCGLGVTLLIVLFGDHDGPGGAPRPPGGGAVVAGGAQNYNINLGPGQQNDRRFTFRAGQRVTITVTTNRVGGPIQPDVDLFVMRGAQMVASDTRISPDCNVTFVAPMNDTYIVRVSNLGPGMANSRVDVR